MRLATWQLYHVMTGEPGPPMTMITYTHLWLWLWSTTQTGTIAQRKQPVSRNSRTCRASIWTIKVYNYLPYEQSKYIHVIIINQIILLCIHLYNLWNVKQCGWRLFFFRKKFFLREKWFFDVDLFTSKVTLEKKQF